MLGIIKKLPDYASDIKINLMEIFEEQKTLLSPKQIYGVALAASYSMRHEQLLNGIRAEAKMYLEDNDAKACKIASTMMTMTNIYYRFIDLSEDEDYKKMDSGLSMLSIQNPQVDKAEMDLYCLGVSILNGCKHCIKAHVKKVIASGLSKEAIKDVAKVISVLQATVNAIEIERMRSYDFVVRDASMD